MCLRSIGISLMAPRGLSHAGSFLCGSWRGACLRRPKASEDATSGLDRCSRVQSEAEDIQLSQAIAGDGAPIFRHACWMDLEGIVSKRIGSRYVSGRTRAWLKTKNPNFERR